MPRFLSRISVSFILKRLLIAIPTLLAVITVAFFMMRAAPGGPFSMDRKLEPAIEQQIMAKYGLDQPLYVQYFDYIGDVARLDSHRLQLLLVAQKQWEADAVKFEVTEMSTSFREGLERLGLTSDHFDRELPQ